MGVFFNTDAQVIGHTSGSIGADGNPAKVEVTRYDNRAAFFRLSSSEMFRLDRTNNKAAYGLVLYPDQIVSTIQVEDVARIGGVDYSMLPGEGDMMGLGDVAYYICEVVE